MRRDRVRVALALLAVLFCQSSQSSGEEDLTSTAITDRLVLQLRNVRSLHITWHKELGNEKFAERNIWAYQGNKVLDCGTKRSHGGPGPYWLSFDGTHSHAVKYWQLDRSQIEEVERGTNPGVPNQVFGLRPLGLNLPGTKETLLTILEKHQPVFGATEDVEGEKTYRLDFGSVTEVWRSPHTLTVWIDSLRFLPRRLELHPSHTSKPPFRIDVAKGETGLRWTIGEFQRVLDEQNGEQCWFPVRVLYGPTAFVFDEVRLNPDLPDDSFLPPTPAGTLIRTGQMVLDPVAKVMVPEVIVAGGQEGRIVRGARIAAEKQESDRITREIRRAATKPNATPEPSQE